MRPQIGRDLFGAAVYQGADDVEGTAVGGEHQRGVAGAALAGIGGVPASMRRWAVSGRPAPRAMATMRPPTLSFPALIAPADWRFAWAAFAFFAAMATCWNGFLLRKTNDVLPARTSLPKLRFRWFAREASRRLFVSAFVFGTVTAVYWTFAVELLVSQGTLAQADSRFFWILLGAFGLLGGAAGDFVTRFGLRRTFRAALLMTALAIGSPAIWPGNDIAVFSSAVIFGAAFVIVTGLFGIWSVNVFNDRPSAGFGATFFLISAGQLAGPALCGMVAAKWGLATTFHLSAILGLIAVTMGPRQDLYSMASPETGHANSPSDRCPSPLS